MIGAAARIVARLQAGDRLHMQLCEDGKRSWWFENPREKVQDRVIMTILDNEKFHIREAGDSLFGFRNNSQTYLAVEIDS